MSSDLKMYYSALLKLASTFLLASYVHTYDLHCSCADKGGAIAELTNKCCSQQKAILQIDYKMNDVDVWHTSLDDFVLRY